MNYNYNAGSSSSASASGGIYTSNGGGGPGSSSGGGSGAAGGYHPHHGGHNFPPAPATPAKFDVVLWYPAYQDCVRYFTEVSQHTYPCQAIAAFINIRLPNQRSAPTSPPPPSPAGLRPSMSTPPNPNESQAQYGWVSLHPYIRRLVATGFDKPEILYGWFGEKWQEGVGPLHEQERRNYLFAAKSGGWASVKRDYDVVCDEAVPYLKQLMRVDDGEIEGAEETWSSWLAMEDWMLGSRAVDDDETDMPRH